MRPSILLYGATGFSGRLIAAEGARAGMADRGGISEFRMVLAGRDGDALQALAHQHGMEYRTFGLDGDNVRRGLRGVRALINAAGPFAGTADRLLQVALAEGCHYVDINGEADVYERLTDYGRVALQRRLAVVCSAGYTAAASDLLLEAALAPLRYSSHLEWGPELNAVRIATSAVTGLSRGSVESLWRSLGNQVTVVGTEASVDESDTVRREPRLWYEPVGKLERTFDFGDHDGVTSAAEAGDLRIASAANLVDTLTAQLTIARHGFSVNRVESYVETGTAARIAYQLGALLAPVAALPWVRTLVRRQIGFLPPGPTEQELRGDRQIVLIEIEDPVHTRILDWRWQTPHAYQFTAQVVVEVAREMVRGTCGGWLTPGALLRLRKHELSGARDALRGCRLNDRLPPTRDLP